MFLHTSLLLNRDLYPPYSLWLRRKRQHSEKPIGGRLTTFPSLHLPTCLYGTQSSSPTVLNLALDSDWLWPWCTEQKWLRREADTYKVAAGRAGKAPMSWPTELCAIWLVVWVAGVTKQAETIVVQAWLRMVKGPQYLYPHIPYAFGNSHGGVELQIPKQSRGQKYSWSIAEVFQITKCSITLKLILTLYSISSLCFLMYLTIF